MTLDELGTIIGKEFCFSITADGETVQASFHNSDTKETADSGILTGEYGSGPTKKDALADYATLLCGKILVINAHAAQAAGQPTTRREFQLPETITP